jgi:hypothetical protein
LIEWLDRQWKRHGRALWIIHSVWSLAAGVAVIVLARERYGFIPWVIGFLALTWLTTLLFSRSADTARPTGRKERFRIELTSYVTRVLYQETLFFLIPFYAYSTVVPSWNMLFVGLLGLMAVLSCLDLVFDRWIRKSPVLGLVFFASVAFATLNLLLPMLLRMTSATAASLAGIVAVASGVPLALRSRPSGLAGGLRLAAAGAVLLAVAVWLQPLVPAVPLRLTMAHFGADFDSREIEVIDPLGDVGNLGRMSGKVVVLARIFAPSSLPSRVVIEWTLDDEPIRTSREVEITAHEDGFRIWDAYSPDGEPLQPGLYRVVLSTVEGMLFGAASVRLQ